MRVSRSWSTGFYFGSLSVIGWGVIRRDAVAMRDNTSSNTPPRYTTPPRVATHWSSQVTTTRNPRIRNTIRSGGLGACRALNMVHAAWFPCSAVVGHEVLVTEHSGSVGVGGYVVVSAHASSSNFLIC